VAEFSYRLNAAVLLGTWIFIVCSFGWSLEYSSMDFYQEQTLNEKIGTLGAFILVTAIQKVAKKLDKNYTCPVYCGVNHIHIYRNYEEKESNLQAVNRIHGPDRSEDKEQSTSSLRYSSAFR